MVNGYGQIIVIYAAEWYMYVIRKINGCKILH